jgi:hypothetical protein
MLGAYQGYIDSQFLLLRTTLVDEQSPVRDLEAASFKAL